MSLIVGINPVPWKILDLVRARMLKNRTKKAKKGLDWSKETLRREMALAPAPLISRRRDEPSFVLSQSATFVIEGSMRRIDYPFGTEEPYNMIAPYIYQESWNIYRQNTDAAGTRTYFPGVAFMFPYNVTTSYFSRFLFENPRNYKSRFYVSFFLTDSDEFIAVTTGIETGAAEASPNGYAGPFQTWKRGSAILQGGFSGTQDILTNDAINPLHAWQEKRTTPSYRALVNDKPPWVAAQVPCPVDPEFDEARISTIPGYIQTTAFDFAGYPQISGVLQTQQVTVEL
jgi:hypothetical protein